MIIFKWIEAHYIALIADSNHIKPLRVIIMKTVRIGKSYLIQAIWYRILEIKKKNKSNAKSPILMLIPIGVVAFNVYGITIHSTFSIPVNNTNFDINSEWLKQLQNRLQNVKYIIIDEKSMIGCKMFALIDMWLC